MYDMLNPRHMGRDYFERFCFEEGLKVVIKGKKYKTTDSRGVIRFPNLLLELEELSGVNQLWVSDITYFDLAGRVYYITFILDIFNREIVGYSLSKTLKTLDTSLKALQMGLENRKIEKGCGIIFHSDGGGQYYSKEFLSVTRQYGIKNSMGKTAYENPHAERINGTIKNDYLIPYQPENFEELNNMLKKAVTLYNTQRPHQSLQGHTPQRFSRLVDDGLLTKVWVVNKRKKETKKEKVNIIIK